MNLNLYSFLISQHISADLKSLGNNAKFQYKKSAQSKEKVMQISTLLSVVLK